MVIFTTYLKNKGKSTPIRVGSPIIKKSDSRMSLGFPPVSALSISS